MDDESELVHEFRRSLEELAGLVDTLGIQTLAYSDPSLESFTRLDLTAKRRTYATLRTSIDSLANSLDLFYPDLKLQKSRADRSGLLIRFDGKEF